ncbi:MAG: DUF1127 domain-containing protein [Enhydrobacter sp.]|nr:MAG: DUF1127 domain-containing protein [Enhydrobacter sp.]
MSLYSRNRFLSPPDFYVSPTVPRPSLADRIAIVLAVWRERSEQRRRLGEMDARALRDVGISPAAAAFESGQPFWRRMGSLR